MGILSNILGKIFPHASAATPPAQAGSPSSTATASTPPSTASAVTGAPAAAKVAPINEVDVEKLLDGMAEKSGEKLNWKTSIVDLMKLLGLDSSLASRKELAQELHYSGDTADSASMNVWLHRQVMGKLAENGGKVPDSLK